MKNLMIVLMLAFASLAGAGPVQFENKTQVMDAGSPGTITDSAPTYALNSVSSTVTSAYIDLSATGMLFVCVSATSGTSPLVGVQFSNTNTAQAFGTTSTAAVNSVQQLGAGCYPIKAAGRWLRFANQSQSLTAKVSVNYYVVSQASTNIATQSLGGLTATSSAFTKFTMNATTATAQYLTVTAGSYVLFSNPGSVDIIGDWSTSAATPANLSNTGAVRIPAGQMLSQRVANCGGMILGYPYFIYSNMNTTSPSAQANY